MKRAAWKLLLFSALFVLLQASSCESENPLAEGDEFVATIEMIAFGYALDNDVKHMAMAVLNEDRTVESRQFIDRFVNTETFRVIGRATQGVRLIDIEGDDRAVSIARLAEKDDEAERNGEEP